MACLKNLMFSDIDATPLRITASRIMTLRIIVNTLLAVILSVVASISENIKFEKRP
jgi:hypothetical protein